MLINVKSSSFFNNNINNDLGKFIDSIADIIYIYISFFLIDTHSINFRKWGFTKFYVIVRLLANLRTSPTRLCIIYH